MKKVSVGILCLILLISLVFTPLISMGATYEYTTWKQSDSRWGSTPLGTEGDTVAQSGCVVTSIAILMVHSGAVTTDPTMFNPGIFCKWLNANGGLTSDGCIYWSAPGEYTSKFSYVERCSVSGLSNSKKIEKIASYISQGCVVVAEVKNGGHYVAIDHVADGKAYIFDPARSGYDDLFDYSSSGVNVLQVYKGPSANISGESSGGGDSSTPPDTTIGALGTGTYLITSDDGLNIRSGPGTGNSIVGGIPYNTSIYVSKVQNGWGYITYSGVSGWITLEYTKMTAPDFIGLKVTPPTKTTYTAGEQLNTSGMVVTALYSDNTQKTVSSGYTVSGYKSTSGTHTITVAYNGKGATFTVTVTSPITPPQPTTPLGTYAVNSSDGVNVRSGPGTNYSILTAVVDKTQFVVTEISSNWGKTTINGVTGWIYLEYTTLIAPAVDNSTISASVNITRFLVNNKIPNSALTVHKVETNGTKTPVTAFTLSGYDHTTPGDKTVTVTANGKTTTVKVNYIARGDADCNGKIDSIDALTALTRSVNKITDEGLFDQAADVDNDSKITSSDAMKILQFVVKKISAL